MKFMRNIFLLLIIVLLPGITLGDEHKNILLINSDSSVARYKTAQDAFINTVAHQVFRANISDSKQNETTVIEMLSGGSFDVVYCIGAKAYMTAQQNSVDTEIIFSSTINWMRLPETDRAYGVSNEFHPAMQVMLFRYIFPDVKKVGILYSKRYNQQWFNKTVKDARKAGIDIVGQPMSKKMNAPGALQKLLPKIDALWLISDPVVISDAACVLELLEQCDLKKIPVFAYDDIYAKYGAVLVISVDTPTIGQQAAGIAEELLSGRKPDNRVQYPAGSHIILNLKKVKEYGLKYSNDALGSVNSIIE